MKVTVTTPRISYRRIGWMHADSDGGPVLRKNSSWRTVNGFYITVGQRRLWIELRRRGFGVR